jgi:hypothetical protein
VLAVAAISIGIWGVAALALAVNSKLRALAVLAQFALLINPSTGSTVLATLIQIGGGRIVPLIQGYASIVDHYGAGHGIASWLIAPVVAHVEQAVGIGIFDIPELYNENGIYTPEGGMGQVKPQSFLAAIAWDTGVLGLTTSLAVICAVQSVARRTRRLGEYRYLFLVPAIVQCAFFTQIPLLAPWLMMVFAMTPNPSGFSALPDVRQNEALTPPRVLSRPGRHHRPTLFAQNNLINPQSSKCLLCCWFFDQATSSPHLVDTIRRRVFGRQ